MIKTEVKMDWSKKANLSKEDKKEIFMATMMVMCPPLGAEMLWKENMRLKKALKEV